MLESPVRPKQSPKSPKPPKLQPRKARPTFKKHYQLMTLVLLCSLGWFTLRSCHGHFSKSQERTPSASSLVPLRSLAPSARQSQL
ncbi:MAG: hypothetical protein RLZZ04_4220, partial [Cyanobacteriota bacterium]